MIEEISISRQAVSFLLFVAGGILTGGVCDLLKLISSRYIKGRRSSKVYDIISAVFLFLFVLFYFLLINNLDIKLYCFIGIIMGILLYFSAFSRISRKFLLIFLNFFEKILKILLYPVKILCIIVKRCFFLTKKILASVYAIISVPAAKIIGSFGKMFRRAKKI